MRADSRARASATTASMRNPRTLVPLALLLALPACTVPLQSTWFTDHAQNASATGAREGTLTVTDDMGPLAVSLDVTCTGGTAVWTLRDPDGVCRWRCSTGTAARIEQHVELARRPGTWTVRREWREFSGSQSFSVAAESGDRLRIGIVDVTVRKR